MSLPAPQVLFVSHSPTLPTGYGRVVRALAGAFQAAGWQVTVLGMGYESQAHPFPYVILPCPQDAPHDAVAAVLRTARPGLVVSIGDPWMFTGLPDLPGRRGMPWLAYFPVDGYPLPSAWARWIAAVDAPVVFSRFTQKLVADATGREPRLIHHGVDTSLFAPADKAAARRRVGLPEDAFVVGTVAANQQRKNLPALVKAFAEFARGKPDAMLYLHTPLVGCWDVGELVERLGVQDRTRVTVGLEPGRGIPDEALASVYNALDLFALPTMAEGFGLPLLESQACGVPALATDFSACSELLPDPFQRVRVKDTLVMAGNFEQAVVDADDLAAKFRHFYHDRAALRDLGQRCRSFALALAWDSVTSQFLDVARELIAARRNLTP